MAELVDVTDFDRGDAQLEDFFLSVVCLAGKPTAAGRRQIDELRALLAREHHQPLTPFALLNFCEQDAVAAALKAVGIGCNSQKASALCQTAGRWVVDQLDLRTCGVAQLEAIRWVGSRTARYFLLHSRRGARVAVVDDDVLRHLRARGVADVPATAPGKGTTYLRLEREFLRLADEAGVMPVEYDRVVRQRHAERDSP